ncbi:MAG: hypothetical protein Q9198_001117, partial [Flavoplaca austrocitrina]
MVVSPERTALLRQKVATHAGGNKAKYLGSVKANKISKNKKKEEQAKTLATKKDLLETARKQHEANPNDEAAKKALDAQNEELKKLETEIQTYDADIMQWEREEEDLD